MAVALEILQESATDLGGTHMRAIYECADDSPTRPLHLDLVAKRGKDRLDLVGIEAAACEKRIQSPPAREIVEASEHLPLFHGHSAHSRFGIQAVAVAKFVERLVRELAPDAATRELLYDAATGGPSREKLGAGELSREIGIVQILPLLQPDEGCLDVSGRLSLRKKLATQLRYGSSAEAQQLERSIVGCRRAGDRRSVTLGVSGSPGA